MKNEELKKLTPYQRLRYWIETRYIVSRLKYLDKPKPWTDNEILQTVYFTNVHREDDKVTCWLSANLRLPLSGMREIVFATIAFRWFNFIPTGRVLLTKGGLLSGNHSCGYFTDWNMKQVIRLLLEYQKNGNQVFTGAYNISNSGSTKPKVNRVCEDYIQPVWEQNKALCHDLERAGSLAKAHKILSTLPGLGGSGFMAAQIVADLKHTHVLMGVPDEKTWCSIGPGSKRGMNRLLGRPIEQGFSKEEFAERISELQKKVNTDLKGVVPYIDAQDLQSCLCEFFKFERELWDLGGHSKRKYNGLR